VAVAVFQLRMVELLLLHKPQVSYQALEVETVIPTGLQTSQHPQTLLIQLGLEVPEGLVAALMVVTLRQLAAAAQERLALREVLAPVATVVRVCKVQSQATLFFTLPAVVVA